MVEGQTLGGHTLGGHTLQPRISDRGEHLPGGGQMLGGQTLGGHTLQPRISDLGNHLPGGGQMLGGQTLGATRSSHGFRISGTTYPAGAHAPATHFQPQDPLTSRGPNAGGPNARGPNAGGPHAPATDFGSGGPQTWRGRGSTARAGTNCGRAKRWRAKRFGPQPRISELGMHLPVLFRKIKEDPSSKLV